LTAKTSSYNFIVSAFTFVLVESFKELGAELICLDKIPEHLLYFFHWDNGFLVVIPGAGQHKNPDNAKINVFTEDPVYSD
jgi:hypothetical protein